MKQTQAISKETLSTIYGGNKLKQCLNVQALANVASRPFGSLAFYYCATS